MLKKPKLNDSMKTYKNFYNTQKRCPFHYKESESAVAQSCLTLCDPMDHSLLGSSVHGIFQAKVLECIAISFSRGSSQPRDWTQVSHIAGRHFTVWATREDAKSGLIDCSHSFKMCLSYPGPVSCVPSSWVSSECRVWHDCGGWQLDGRHSLFSFWVSSGLSLQVAVMWWLMSLTSFVSWYGW